LTGVCRVPISSRLVPLARCTDATTFSSSTGLLVGYPKALKMQSVA
jgi:hypothetical protein